MIENHFLEPKIKHHHATRHARFNPKNPNSMTKTLHWFASATSLTLGAIAIFLSTQNDKKIAYVDINRLVNEYKGTEASRKQLEEHSQLLTANIDSLIADWQQELKTYERERAAMTQKEKELQEELLAKKQLEIDNFQESVRRNLQQKDQDLSAEVYQKINEAVQEYSQAAGYDLVLGANGDGSIMYSEDAFDITAQVLTELNKE